MLNETEHKDVQARQLLKIYDTESCLNNANIQMDKHNQTRLLVKDLNFK